jgi:hypothetical protein
MRLLDVVCKKMWVSTGSQSKDPQVSASRRTLFPSHVTLLVGSKATWSGIVQCSDSLPLLRLESSCPPGKVADLFGIVIAVVLIEAGGASNGVTGFKV